ncbi:Lrp/AsnC family transcriptional regulator [Kutzneria buriramensis]|uniref:DNA-binding Lrp family transcriptional regulator n=1 Tax=Kutzneria buriramensis TaxID=1045776 RepID=A0A3E0GZB0_9PSEU|nr:Lrp/AsnC family transcriptional regulator [Kutzneria buriramensis]REH35187.1 DNA-binding Lrp family transcriptional regulator [Kutzneria buriramensis]
MSIETDVTPGPAGRSAAELDDVDRAIIAELRRDGRMSIRTLADRVHISRTSAYARLDRLLAAEVITGFTAEISPRRAGLGTSAYVLLTIEQNTWRSVAKALRGIRYIEHLALVGGDFDVLALVHAPDNLALREVVLERIQSVKGVRATRTWLVFEEDPGLGPQWGSAQRG